MSANPEMYLVSANGVKVGVDVQPIRRDRWFTYEPIALRAGNGPFECEVYVDAARARRLAEMLMSAADRVDGEP